MHQNKHIADYITYYWELKKGPEYAILLRGPWGAGKTLFVENLLEEKNIKHLYVSLYGMSNVSEIEDSFYQQLHPLLSSPGAVLLGKVAKGLIKTAVKIDLNRDGNPDVTINSSIPDIDLEKYFKGADERLLVFDDLERSGMEIRTVLGYINYFVEHKGFKVILVANEDELLKDPGYQPYKEKLIGKDFSITPELDAAIESFISEISNDDVKRFLNEHRGAVKSAHAASKYENLRLLRQALLEFERIYPIIPRRAHEHTELMEHILRVCLIFAIEIRNGGLLPADIASMSDDYWLNFIKKDDDKPTPKQMLLKKYGELEFHRPIPNEQFWREYFETAVPNATLMKEAVLSSQYFLEESTPEWKKLWYHNRLSDDEFIALLGIVSDQFSKQVFTKLGEIKHVVGMFLRFSDDGLYELSKQDILQTSKNYLDELGAAGKLEDQQDRRPFEYGSYDGLGYSGLDIPEFREFDQYSTEVRERIKRASFPDRAKQLLEDLKTDPVKFYMELTVTGNGTGEFYAEPILKYIPKNAFVAALLDAGGEVHHTVSQTFKERCQTAARAPNLLEELDWLIEVQKGIEEAAESRKGRLSSVSLRHLAVSLNDQISILKTGFD
jgi:hypothetical protein